VTYSANDLKLDVYLTIFMSKQPNPIPYFITGRLFTKLDLPLGGPDLSFLGNP
jgi:hypothetical protein